MKCIGHIRRECGAHDGPTKPPGAPRLLTKVPRGVKKVTHRHPRGWPEVVARSGHQNQPHPQIPVSRPALDAEGRQARIAKTPRYRSPSHSSPSIHAFGTPCPWCMDIPALFPRAQHRACTAPSSFLNGGAEDRSPRHRFLTTGWAWLPQKRRTLMGFIPHREALHSSAVFLFKHPDTVDSLCHAPVPFFSAPNETYRKTSQSVKITFMRCLEIAVKPMSRLVLPRLGY